MKKSNDFLDFKRDVHTSIQGEYTRVQKKGTDDPGAVGIQGEENWAGILRNWLPQNFRIITNGKIMSALGETSLPLELIVLGPEYPKFLLDRKIYLAEGVIAAFECKTIMKATDVKKFFENSVKVKSFLYARGNSPYTELNNGIIYGLLSHSHNWKNATPASSIYEKITDCDREIIKHPKHMPDLLCITDLGVWSNIKYPLLHNYKKKNPVESDERGRPSGEFVPDGDGYIGTAYTQFTYDAVQKAQFEYFTPIGAFLTLLLHKMAYRHAELRSVFAYFMNVRTQGKESGGKLRTWNIGEIYSPEVLAKLDKISNENGREFWDEWGYELR